MLDEYHPPKDQVPFDTAVGLYESAGILVLFGKIFVFSPLFITKSLNLLVAVVLSKIWFVSFIVL